MRNRKKNLRNLSTSNIYTKRLKNRASLSGGVTVDRSVAIDRIRNSSIGLSQNILKPTESNCSFVYNPSSYGENKNYVVYPDSTGNDFSFTRATTATVTNKDGSIGDSCYNLLQFSEDYTNPVWTKFNTTITANSTTNYLGQNIASKLVENTASSLHEMHESFTLNTGIIYTESAFLKYAGRQFVTLQIGNTKQAVFDLQNGLVINLVGSGTTATITPYSDGWYYCTVSSIPDTGLAYVVLQLNSSAAFYTGDGVSGVYVCGMQVTQGSMPKDYLRTTNRLAVPRIDYSLDLTKPSLLIEPQSTNLALQSGTLDAGSWSANSTTLTANTNLNPFNVNKSYYITENTSTASHSISQNTSLVSGTTYTMSYYVKKAGVDWIQLSTAPAVFGSNAWANFNFTTGNFGNIGSSATVTKKQLINGYWLLTLTAICTGTASNSALVISGTNNTDVSSNLFSYLGTGAVLCDLAASQLEVGANATTYIPTTTATVTRNGETSYVYLWNNGLLNKDNFTLYVEGTLLDINSTTANIFLGDSLSPNYTDGWYQGFKAVTVVNGADIITGVSLSVGTKFKTIITGNGNTAKFYRNGTLIATHTRPAFDYRYLNINHAGDTYTIDKIELYKETLSDAQCVTKTT